MKECPYCNVYLTKCDEDCCGGMLFCHICGKDEDDFKTVEE